MEVLDKKLFEERRRKKEEKRRKVKEERKNRIKEKANQQALAKGTLIRPETDKSLQKLKETQIEKRQTGANVEQLDDEILQHLTFADKIGLVKAIGQEIISFPAFRFRKLKDLLKMCSDPKDVDVVLKAVTMLATVFCDILPSYRIREFQEGEEESKEAKVSKDVEQLRTQEQFILGCYKEYLQILEVFANVKVSKLSKQTSDKATSSQVYIRLREASVRSFCQLLERHPHFNFRVNILKMVAARLAIQDRRVRDECTQALANLLRKDDDGLLSFKVDILKEIHKIVKVKDHNLMSPALMDCLVLHDIMVDETKV